MQNRFLRKASSLLTTGALALGFAVASARQVRAQSQPPQKDSVTQTQVSNEQPGHTYWTHPDYDGVLDVWNCPERGICAKVHAVNPQDERVRKAAAGTLKKNVKDVTDEDVMKQFCGYEAQFSEMKEAEPGHWNGKIYIISRDSYFGVELKERPDGEHMNMRGYLLGFLRYLFLGDPYHVLGKGSELSRVHDVPPACKAPPKDSLPASPAPKDTFTPKT
jgi:hypothetical protein